MNSENAMIEAVKNDFYKNCFGDVERAIYGWEEQKGCLMGAFILLSCIIDYLAKFAYGLEASKPGQHGKYYKQFIIDYLKKIDSRYNAEDLYHNLRCGLVHHYSTMYEGSARLLFTHNKPGQNLAEVVDELSGEKRTLLELFAFKCDVYSASKLLFQELERNTKMRSNFVENYNKYKFITTGIPLRSN